MDPEEKDQLIDPISLKFIVSQSLYLLEIDPLEGPGKAGYTDREFGMYVLSGIHQSRGVYQLVELSQTLLDSIKEQLGIITKQGLMGNAIEELQLTEPKNRRRKKEEI